jgi:hypothetical protein
MTTHATSEPRRELAHLTADRLEIRLLWDAADDTVAVEVFDRRYDQIFEVGVPAGHALDAFHHPFAYTGAVAA